MRVRRVPCGQVRAWTAAPLRTRFAVAWVWLRMYRLLNGVHPVPAASRHGATCNLRFLCRHPRGLHLAGGCTCLQPQASDAFVWATYERRDSAPRSIVSTPRPATPLRYPRNRKKTSAPLLVRQSAATCPFLAKTQLPYTCSAATAPHYCHHCHSPRVQVLVAPLRATLLRRGTSFCSISAIIINHTNWDCQAFFITLWFQGLAIVFWPE